MKRIITIFILILSVYSSIAQPSKSDRHEKIRALHIAFITNELDLTPEQSEKFWPVYNQYQKERREIRHKFFKDYRDANPSSDPKLAKAYIEDNIEYQEEELAIKKEYKDKLLKAITAQQLATLYKSEEKFKKMLLERLHQRSEHRGK